MNAKTAWDLTFSVLAALLIAFALFAEHAVAAPEQDRPDQQTSKKLEQRLLKAAQDVQYPGSESDSTWRFVSYPTEAELPDAARFEDISGCPVTEYGGTGRFDFDKTFDRLTKIEPWMDEGQVKSARGFRKIERVMLRSYDERAVYRCDTGEYGQVYLYFVGLGGQGVSGLLTVSTET